MRFAAILCIVFFLSLQTGCMSQQSGDVIDFAKQDQHLADIYTKYYENRSDYGDTFGEARDTILIRFRETLQKTVANSASIAYPFKKLGEKIKIITSKDKKLRIFSWDELNGGTWHIYNAMFQYQNETYASGSLAFNKKQVNSPSYSDVGYVHIDKLEDDSYLIKGYGTHGSGQDFYIFRKLHFENNTVKDCNGCFNGKNQLLFTKPRTDKTSPVYQSASKIIVLPEYKENEDTGFLEKTSSTRTLQFKNGNFIKTN